MSTLEIVNSKGEHIMAIHGPYKELQRFTGESLYQICKPTGESIEISGDKLSKLMIDFFDKEI
jgi:hypothetical protein